MNVETEFFTIGVYGLTADQFFGKLVSNNIDTFIDIRRRRAVRGSKFSFVNSTSLQKRLADLNIKYIHIVDLSPTNEIRALQKSADIQLGVSKRERSELGEVFIKEYKSQILDKYDLAEFVKNLEALDIRKAVLFCVEKEPAACHRSIVAERLKSDFNARIINL